MHLLHVQLVPSLLQCEVTLVCPSLVPTLSFNNFSGYSFSNIILFILILYQESPFVWKRKEGVQYYAPLPQEERGMDANKDHQESRHFS